MLWAVLSRTSLLGRYLASMKSVPTSQHDALKQKIEAIIETVTKLKNETSPDKSGVASKLKAKSRNIRAQNAYTTKELDVLRRSSTINGRIFLPWIDIDLEENFDFEEPFSDPDGLLALSSKQLKHFAAWRRPHMFNASRSKLTMIEQISPHSITQDIVTDCSFVASLCITASYEQRFKKQLITRVIYPQDDTGAPRYNRCGKYMVKLWINGVPRKVIVDDMMPVDKNGKLLCSCTTRPNELWVSTVVDSQSPVIMDETGKHNRESLYESEWRL